MANSVNPDQTEQSVLGPHVLLLYLNLPEMIGNYLQQTTSSDDIFRCIFLGALRVKTLKRSYCFEMFLCIYYELLNAMFLSSNIGR